MITGPRKGPVLRIFLNLLAVASISLATSPSNAAVATGSLSVSAVVINQCAISSNRVVGGNTVRCNGTTPAYKVVENTVAATGPESSALRTVYF